MSQLAELQRTFARAVMRGDPGGLPAFVGRVSPASAFRVHHATVIGGLTGALRLKFPTVDSLVGPDFFDHAARQFIDDAPPATANLGDYGDGFGAFLGGLAPDLPYLPNVAELDLAIDRAGRQDPRPPRQFVIDTGVGLSVPGDLRLLDLAYPAHDIRALLEAGQSDGLSDLDMTPGRYLVAVWRGPQGAMAKLLAEPAGLFLRALLEGQSAERALAAATAAADEPTALAAIQADVFAASFATITSRVETP